MLYYSAVFLRQCVFNTNDAGQCQSFGNDSTDARGWLTVCHFVNVVVIVCIVVDVVDGV